MLIQKDIGICLVMVATTAVVGRSSVGNLGHCGCSIGDLSNGRSGVGNFSHGLNGNSYRFGNHGTAGFLYNCIESIDMISGVSYLQCKEGQKNALSIFSFAQIFYKNVTSEKLVKMFSKRKLQLLNK